MNCWLRLASSAQKICNSIFCGSRGELPSTHCAFLGQFHNTSQYLTILYNTTTVLPRSIPQQLIRRCVWVALWRRDHPPPPPIRNPAFPFAQSAFSRPALQVQGAVFKCRFLTFSMHIALSILLILQMPVLQLLYFQSFRCDNLWPYLGEGAVFLSKYFGGDIFDNFGEIAIGGNPKQILAPCLTDALR